MPIFKKSMCYINALRASLAEFISYKQQEKELKQLHIPIANRPLQKGFEYADWLVIKPSIDGKDWNIEAMQCGFIPSYLRCL